MPLWRWLGRWTGRTSATCGRMPRTWSSSWGASPTSRRTRKCRLRSRNWCATSGSRQRRAMLGMVMLWPTLRITKMWDPGWPSGRPTTPLHGISWGCWACWRRGTTFGPWRSTSAPTTTWLQIGLVVKVKWWLRTRWQRKVGWRSMPWRTGRTTCWTPRRACSNGLAETFSGQKRGARDRRPPRSISRWSLLARQSSWATAASLGPLLGWGSEERSLLKEEWLNLGMRQSCSKPWMTQRLSREMMRWNGFSEDSWGRGQANMRKYVRMLHPNAVLLDMPHAGPVSGVVETLGALGYDVATLECRTSDFGDGVAKLKVIIVGSRGRKASLWSMPPARAIEPNGICRCLKEAGNRISPDWVGEGCQIELNAKISTSGDRMLPWPAGHLYTEGEKQLIYDARGPALTFRKDAKMPIVDHQGRDSQCRWLRPEEEWIINGGRIEELEAMREMGAASCQFKDGAIKRMPQNSAHHILAWLERERQRGGDQRVGLCADRDRQNTDEQVKAWLKAWKGNRGNPATQYEKFLKDERENSLVGGRKPSKGGRRAKSSPPETTVFPAAIGQGRERLMLDANRELSKDKEWLDALAAEAVMSKLSEGTRAGYEIGWKQWCLWRRLEKNGAYLLGETKDERKQDEDEILRFITFLAKVMKRTEGTIKQRIFAIKMGHLVAGHDDPTLNRSRIWAALNGFKRWQPETKRKYPVLPSMLRWMKTHLESSHTLTKDKVKDTKATYFLVRRLVFSPPAPN